MSGFENMSSKYNQLLHPAVDPSDKFDPTFLGVTRKRRADPPKTEFFMEERGKRINVSMTHHNPENIWQLDSQYVPETFKGDTRSTRFGRGFNRRHADTIACDAQRKVDDQHRSEVKAERAEERRLRSVARGSAFNPLTGEAPIVSKYFPVPAAHEELRHAQPRPSCKAMSPRKWQSSVFSATPSTATATTGPSSVVARGSEAASGGGGGGARRHQFLGCEGLTATKKDWGAREQLQCYDGFVLPNIASASSAASSGTKHASTPARVSTRPW